MAPRTILFLHPSADLYGADRTLIELVQGLDATRWRAVVALPHEGPLVDELKAAGARVHILPLGVGGQRSLSWRGLSQLARDVPRAILATRRLARREAATLVHTNTMVVLGGALGAKLSGARHVWHVHEIPTAGWLTRVFARLFDFAADRVVCNSHATAEHFRRARPQLGRKLEVVWNGTRVGGRPGGLPGGRPAAAAALRTELGLAAEEPLVLLLGRINSWKGQSLLVDAARKLRDEHPRAHFLVAGSPPPGQEHFEDALRQHVTATGMEDRISVRGFDPDPTNLFLAADIVAVPSTRPEPFGLVAIEAMALGRPVVAANHGGLTEIVEEGQTGLLFEPGSAESLAQELGELLAAPERRRRMGARGRKRQQEHFTIPRYCASFAELYASFDGAPASTRHPKIVHLTIGKANPERMNGVNVVIHHLARAQARADFDVELWGITDTPDGAGVSREHGARFFQRRRSRFFLSRDLGRALSELNGPHVFHLHGGFLPEMHAAARALTRLGIPFVFTPHGAYRREALRKNARAKSLYLRLFERRVLRAARRVQTFAAPEAHDTSRLVDEAKIATVPNGQSLPEKLPGAARSGHEGPIIGFCGRVDVHTKGLDLLVEAFERHVRAGGKGSLHVIGGGPGLDVLRSFVAQTGIADRVHFFGPRYGDPKLALLRELDVFALTSRHEGMPTAVLEAASLGCALLVTPETNVAENVRAARAGFTPPRGDVESIVAALSAVEAAARAGELPAMGQRARRMAEEHFSWDHIALRLGREVYEIEPRDPAQHTPIDDASSERLSA